MTTARSLSRSLEPRGAPRRHPHATSEALELANHEKPLARPEGFEPPTLRFEGRKGRKQ